MGRLVGATRYVILLGVAGNLLAAAVLFFSGVVQVVRIAVRFPTYATDTKGLKALSIEAIQLADYFLIATALYIVAVGLYELFVGELALPPRLAWLKVSDIDALKDRLIGVAVTVLSVTFLAIAANYDGADILAFGAALAAVIVALGAYRRLSRD